MYQPAHFKVEDRAALIEVIRAHPLAQLVTSGPAGLMANPIPF
ncbi:MAG: FMN-binding negative transcriptional regulator, partial [Bosea sp. (in: a-proteobacteria)]